jgi:UDP-N-acetyl-D-galactosamine dehydrogenase
MGRYVANKVVQHIIQHIGDPRKARVLVKGATFKEDVSDIRNSKVSDVIKVLQEFFVQVDVVDPHADSDELMHEYGFGLADQIGSEYDAVIVPVPHQAYRALDDAYFASITRPDALIVDLKGIYRNQILSRKYWSL